MRVDVPAGFGEAIVIALDRGSVVELVADIERAPLPPPPLGQTRKPGHELISFHGKTATVLLRNCSKQAFATRTETVIVPTGSLTLTRIELVPWPDSIVPFCICHV